MSSFDDSVRDRVRDRMDIHLPGLIKTLGEAMYADPWVAVRELIQNASDTCTMRRSPLGEGGQALDPSAPKAFIRVYYEPLQARLVVEDNGCGMTYDEVKQFLSVIGMSKTNDVREALENMGADDWADRLIGRFGLGLLSAFIIGQPVVFETRSYKPGSSTVWWRCDGGQAYEMGHVDVERGAGTTVSVEVDTAHRHMFSDEERLVAVIKRYADLLPIPIYLGKTSYRQVNVMDAPWIRQATLPEYSSYLQQRFPDDSILHVIPVEIDQQATDTTPALRMGGALFIPKQPDPLRVFVKEYGTVEVYAHRMFVTENEPDLLPKWARFVKGVVDSPDLRETTSRESIRHDENFQQARKALGQLILDNFRTLATNDQKQFREIAAQHNVVIKAMAIAQPELFDAVRDIVLFKVENRVLSLNGYFNETGQSALPADQKRKVYYSSGVYGVGQHSFLFAQQGWRVIDASSYPDEPFLIAYSDRFPDEIELVSVDAVGEHVFVKVEPKEEKWLNLEDAFLRDRIDATVVKYEPDNIPAVLVDVKDAQMSDEQLDQILKAEDLDQQIKSVFEELKIARERRRRSKLSSGAMLYLNANSNIIQRLAGGDLGDPDIASVIRVLYNNAVMLSARALTADTAKVIFDGNNRTIAQLMDKTEAVKRLREAGADPDAVRRLKVQNDDLRTDISRLEQGTEGLRKKLWEITEERDGLTREIDDQKRQMTRMEADIKAYRALAKPEPPSSYITCFVMLPFAGYDDIFEELQGILEVKPYFWRVARADQETRARTVNDSVKQWLDRSHCYIAEITARRSSVMMELGYAYWDYRDRPLLLLQRVPPPDGVSKDSIVDLAGVIRVEYEWDKSVSLEDRRSALSDKILTHKEFAQQRGAAHYLSSLSISAGISPEARKQLCAEFRTIEQYVQAVDEDLSAVTKKVPLLGAGMARDIRDQLKELAGL